MDGLLLPETLFSLDTTPASIIGDTNSALHRLERHLLNYLNELDARGFNVALNTYLGCEAAFALPMRYQEDYVPSETAFSTQARNNSVDGLSSPYLDRDYSAVGLFNELTESSGGSVTNRLEQNINYIKNFLAGPPLSQPTAGDPARYYRAAQPVP